jgi:hypothetical protein
MSKIEVDAIDKQSGSTLTLGGSGTAVTLGAGATQTGFGRTGTVDWQTTPKTGDFTGANGEGYFINTTSGEITMTLPSASAGDIISIQDYNNTFDSNSFIIQAPSGVKINGGTAAGQLLLSTEGQGLTLIYVDATVGWRSIESTTFSSTSAVPTFITATGGTITCSGDFKIHTFTGPGTFTVCSVGNALGSNTVDYLVVAGGGSGAGEIANGYGSGAGGAGGYRESSGAASGSYTISPLGACVAALPVTATGFPITVGAGGAKITAPSTSNGNSGSVSTFSTITSAGGGFGSSGHGGGSTAGSGGSGGGAYGSGGAPKVGAGNTPSVSPPQGNPGGQGKNTPYAAGGGGGATQAGQIGISGPQTGGAGGAGATSSINGTPTARAGGGGGGVYRNGPAGDSGAGGAGGTGGGGPGGPGGNNAVSGTTNTGGGGGGASTGFNPCFAYNSGDGGSGIVIIRYKFQ